MPRPSRHASSLPRSHALIGLALWLWAVYNSLAGQPWARQWFYHIAWWGYIIFIDGLVKARQNNSLLMDRQGAFFLWRRPPPASGSSSSS